MKQSLVKGVVAALVLVVALPFAASHAEAAPLSCGQVITQSVTLTANLGPCANNGVVIGADNIVLDLNGFTISGVADGGDGAGVLLQNRRGVTVRRGRVTAFDGGVVIIGGSGNTVTQISAVGNVGDAQNHPAPNAVYGDGILIKGSTNNSIIQNVADNNGPLSGISIIVGTSPGQVSTGNLLQANTVRNNVACRDVCDNIGIRLEVFVGASCTSGSVICPGPGNRLIANVVTGNGLDGISLFNWTTNNVVYGNTVFSNGFFGAVTGDGIRVFGSNNTVEANRVRSNARGGVSVGRRPGTPTALTPPNGRNNKLLRNTAGANGVVDLWDSNPDCDNNTWSGNTGDTFTPACTKNP